MGKEYRISRSIRAQWFFEQFNKTLSDPKSHDELVRWQSMVLQVEKVLVTMAIIEKKFGYWSCQFGDICLEVL